VAPAQARPRTPGVSSRCTTSAQIPPGCTPRLQWGPMVAWSSTAVTTGFVRGHRAPLFLRASCWGHGRQWACRAPGRGRSCHAARWRPVRQHAPAAVDRTRNQVACQCMGSNQSAPSPRGLHGGEGGNFVCQRARLHRRPAHNPTTHDARWKCFVLRRTANPRSGCDSVGCGALLQFLELAAKPSLRGLHPIPHRLADLQGRQPQKRDPVLRYCLCSVALFEGA
jgi:hypothetical protein